MSKSRINIEKLHSRVLKLEKQCKQLKQHDCQVDQWIEAWVDQWLHVMVGAKNLLDTLEMTPDPSTLYKRHEMNNELTPEQ